MGSRPYPSDSFDGPEAAERFRRTLTRVLTVSKDELKRREAAWKKARKTKKAKPVKSTA